MADTLQFELVSPERRLAAANATQIQIPGVTGDFTAMPNHAPLMTTLRPGIVRVVTPTGTAEFVVTGGFAEVSATSATILAEQATPRDAASREMLDEMVTGAEKSLAEATAENRIAADQRLRDARNLASRLAS